MGDLVTITVQPPSPMLLSGAVGRHCIAEFWGASHLTDVQALSAAMTSACGAAGATLLNIFLHVFEPLGGVTGVALLAESHISIHTWPETGYAAIDIFMCGRSDPEVALAELVRHLEPTKTSVRTLVRGTLN
jgi:S-adenosylmethionine decarboxylase